MTLSVRAIDPASRPFFAGDVSGVDITRPLTHTDAAAIASGMDQFGVLVFHDQHFTDEERRKFTPMKQRSVRRHPVTRRKLLFLASHAGAILGWPVPEARAFLRDLIEHATQRRFIYAHVWRQWDLVMWDNRVTMHRARPYNSGEVRDMHRTTVAHELSTMEQAA